MPGPSSHRPWPRSRNGILYIRWFTHWLFSHPLQDGLQLLKKCLGIQQWVSACVCMDIKTNTSTHNVLPSCSSTLSRAQIAAYLIEYVLRPLPWVLDAIEDQKRTKHIKWMVRRAVAWRGCIECATIRFDHRHTSADYMAAAPSRYSPCQTHGQDSRETQGGQRPNAHVHTRFPCTCQLTWHLGLC